jgi:hypothetical protein
MAMKTLYDKAVARLLGMVAIVAAVPLVFVVIIRVFDGLEPVLAAVGLFVVARFGLQWYWGEKW